MEADQREDEALIVKAHTGLVGAPVGAARPRNPPLAAGWNSQSQLPGAIGFSRLIGPVARRSLLPHSAEMQSISWGFGFAATIRLARALPTCQLLNQLD